AIDPADRFARVEDVVRGLQGVDVAPPRGRIAQRASRRRRLAISAAICALGGGGITVYRIAPHDEPRGVVVGHAPTTGLAPLVDRRGRAELAWVAPRTGALLVDALTAGEAKIVAPSDPLELGHADDVSTWAARAFTADAIATGTIDARGDGALSIAVEL